MICPEKGKIIVSWKIVTVSWVENFAGLTKKSRGHDIGQDFLAFREKPNV